MAATPIEKIHTTWVVTEGKAGMENQCLALARAVGLTPADKIAVKRIAARQPWRSLPPRFWWHALEALRAPDGHFPLAPPWPDLLIACGRQSVAPAIAVKRASSGRCFIVELQNPYVRLDRFDLVVAPAHDRLSGENLVTTMGALHGITPGVLEEAAKDFTADLAHLPRPLIAVLIGGPNRVYRFADGAARDIADKLTKIAREHGAGLAITTSRRTPGEITMTIRDAAADLPAIFWEPNGEQGGRNPYLGFLALADAIVVTGDSVNMVSEAAGTGKPVYVIDLVGGSAKFRQFHAAMRRSGVTRPFTGVLEHWDYAPPDDTARAAREIRRRMA